MSVKVIKGGFVWSVVFVLLWGMYVFRFELWCLGCIVYCNLDSPFLIQIKLELKKKREKNERVLEKGENFGEKGESYREK